MTRRAPLLRRLVAGFARVALLIGLAVMALMVLHITADVLARYVTGRPLPGTIAFVANYYMVAVTFLPLVVAERERRHIEVEVVAQRLPATVQAFLRLACWLAAAAVLALLAWQSWIEAMRAWRNGMFMLEQSVRIDTWISYFLLPVGFASAAFVALSRVLVALVALPAGLAPAVDRAERYFDEAKAAETSVD